MPLRFGLDINAVLVDGALRLTWFHTEAAVAAATVRRIADDLAAALAALVADARAGAGGHTPSDMGLVELDQSDVDDLEELFGDLEDDSW